MAELDGSAGRHACAPSVEPRDLLDIAEDIGDAQLACRFACRALGVFYENEIDPAQAAASVLPDLEKAHHNLGIVIAELRSSEGFAEALRLHREAILNLPITAKEVREAEAALKGSSR